MVITQSQGRGESPGGLLSSGDSLERAAMHMDTRSTLHDRREGTAGGSGRHG